MGIGAWHIMRDKISVGPEATATEVTMKIISSGLAAMPVVNEKQELLGVVSENVILDAIREKKDLDSITAASIIVPAPIVVDTGTSVDELINLLLKSCCSIVTVVHENRYMGVVSRHMLMDILTSPHYARFTAKDRKAPFACR
jgi:predicted transcriptional regulator